MEMDYNKIFCKIATDNNTTVEDVLNEIEMVMASAAESSDPEIRSFWQNFKSSEKKPTPKEFIEYISGILLIQAI